MKLRIENSDYDLGVVVSCNYLGVELRNTDGEESKIQGSINKSRCIEQKVSNNVKRRFYITIIKRISGYIWM